MTRYWLTPVQFQGEEVVLLDERIQLEPAEIAADFMKRMKQVNSRLLISFKASLLLSEDAEAACGIGELPFDLGSKESIVFGPEALELSHCAQSYLDRLPSAMEVAGGLSQLEAELVSTDANAVIVQWIRVIRSWLDRGFGVTLLREDE